jgi:hypothetical protein
MFVAWAIPAGAVLGGPHLAYPLIKDDGAPELDQERYRPGGFGAGENLLTVRFAVHLEPFGQADYDCAPGDISPEARLELDAVIARLNRCTEFEAVLERLLGGSDLQLQLVKPTAKRKKGRQLEL